MRHFSIFVIFFLLSTTALIAGVYSTPTIDGDLSDWDIDELRVDDSTTDSPWGSGDEFDNLWVTWDETNLYVGIEYTASSNAMIVYFDLGFSGGETDFNSTRGYNGVYPRNIIFNAEDDIDLLIASWDSSSPWVWSIVDNNSTDIHELCSIVGSTTVEIAIPWDVIYGDLVPCIVPTDTFIKTVGIIAGGDNWGSPDSAPDNSDTDGDEGPDLLSNLWSTSIDSDSNCIPDDEGPVPVTLSSFTAIQNQSDYAQIEWITQSESNLAGYNLYRNTENILDDAFKINPELISGFNNANEQQYSFTDESVEYDTEYLYWLEVVENSGITEFFGPIMVEIVNQPDNPSPPSSIITGLHQNYPNPFNPQTEVKFAVEESGNVELVVYNIRGQKIRTLYNGHADAGEYISITWDGKDFQQSEVSSGVYLYKLITENNIYLKRMILMK